VLAQVDPSNTIAELVESNNVTASARLGFGNGPDLAVTSIQAPPSAGSGFSAIVTVCNQGTAPAPGTEVQLIASRDTTFDASQPPAGDLPIGFGQSPPLDAGACAAVTLSAWSGFPGANYLFGRVDAFGAVAELVESNNVTAGGVIGFGWGPDLVVEQLLTPTIVGPNAAIDAIVCNVGQGSSGPAQVALYASRDATFEPGFFGPEGDLPVGFANVDPLDAGRCRPVRFTSIPTPPWSSGYLFARADEPGSVEELVEFNNDRMSGLVGFGFGVDLVVTALSAPAAVNGTFTTQVTICNRGTDPSPSTTVELYASADATIEPGQGTDPFVGATTVPTLATNACVTRPVTGAAPLVGEARLGAIVDQANAVVELLDGNNTFVGAVMGFGSGAELVARTVTVPLSTSGTFNVTVQVCNQGTSASSSTQVELFASRDVVLTTPGDAFLGSAPVNALTPGQCQSAQLSAPIPPFDGEVYVLARVDAFNAVLELVESNNVTASAAMTVGFGVDLELRALDADPFVTPGGMLAVRWTVCNIGATGSGGTDLSISSFDGPSPDPRFARWFGFSVPVSPLAAGACTSGTASVPGPVFVGQGWVVGTVDPFGNTTQLRRSNDTRSDGVVVATSFCGDGIVDAGERCDDANFASNDGCSATCQIETRQVWQSIANGTQRTNIAWNYAMGYHFTPTQNGFITRLGGLFNGTKTVRLFDRTTGAVLATAQVTSANGWSYVDIPAVPVQSGRSYTVAVYLAGSGGSQRTGITALPRTSGDVRIDGSTFALTTTNPTARPTNVVTTVMYGQADVVFSRYR
jgi:cysteine-rich repeat protein